MVLAIEKWRKDIWNCSCCAECRETVSMDKWVPGADFTGWNKVCPVYTVGRWEMYAARGRNTIAKYLIDGVLKYSKDLAEDVVYRCCGCKACETICTPALGHGHLGLEPIYTVSIVKAMREDCVNMNLGPPEKLRERDENILKTDNSYGEPAARRASWANNLNLPEEGENLFFVGCVTSLDNPKSAIATVKILQSAGLDIAYLGEKEMCCGQPLIWDGERKKSEDYVDKLIKRIDASGAKRIIFNCPGCYSTFKNDYPDLGFNVGYQISHVSQVLSKLIEEKKIKFSESLNKKVTYHDPCHLGRHSGEYDAPRKVIKAIPGIELVEMQRRKQTAWCCGSGSGGVMITNYTKMAQEIASIRIEEARQIASILVTSCSSCLKNLSLAAKKNKVEMEFYDLPVLVAESMGIKI
ncbi:MAG: (Fe-S)-binding protein [Candidatus Jordarchaeaceae archaeon]